MIGPGVQKGPVFIPLKFCECQVEFEITVA